MNNLDSRFQKKKLFLANKLEMSETLRDKLSDNFENSENYFKELPNIIIGRIPKGPKEDPITKKIIAHTVVGDNNLVSIISYSKNKNKMSLKPHLSSHYTSDAAKNANNTSFSNFNRKTTTRSTDTTHISSTIINQHTLINSNIKGGLNAHSNQKPSYIEMIDDKKINAIYEKYRSIIQENREKEELDKRLNTHFSVNREKYKNTHYTFNDINLDSLSNHYISNRNIQNTNQSNGALNSLNNLSNLNNNNPSNYESANLKTEPSTYNLPNIGIEKSKYQYLRQSTTNSEMPKELKEKLDFQEKTLNLYKHNEEARNRMENYIRKKLHTSKTKLLINSGDSYLVKKEIINLVDSKIPTEEKNGIFNWIISLRRPKNFIGDRTAYVNLGDNYNPIWQCYKDSSPKLFEKVINPESLKKDTSPLREARSLHKNEGSTINEINDLDENIVSNYQIIIISFIFS